MEVRGAAGSMTASRSDGRGFESCIVRVQFLKTPAVDTAVINMYLGQPGEGKAAGRGMSSVLGNHTQEFVVATKPQPL